jgi:hypothetical protein
MKRLLAIVLLTVAALAANAQGLSPKQAFQQLKKLAGTWEMKGPNGETLKVIYKVSGAGNTLIETQFPDQAMEMVSVYHMDGDKLMMTHYCAAGNQPTMVYKPGKDPKVLFFDFVRGSNMKPADMHIHTAKIMLKGADEIQSDWTGYMKMKNAGTTSFELKRVKAVK